MTEQGTAGAETVTGAQSLIKSLESAGRGEHLRHPGRRHPPGVRPPLRLQDPAHPGPPRAGRRPRRPGVRRGHRQGRRLHGHQRPRRDQPGHPDRRRPHGLGPDGGRSPARSAPPQIGTDAFQEADIRGITMPITKHNFLVTDPAEIPRVVAEAFYIASTGRPGPVLVDVAKSALQAHDDVHAGRPSCNLPGYRPVTRPHSKQIREATRLILESRRPVLYVGGGVIRAARVQGAADARRAHRHPGRHHADGARRVPRQPPAAPRHARHARHRRRGRRRCRRAT